MAIFNTKEILQGPASLIPTIAESIREEFVKDGYEVKTDTLSTGCYDISITKGSIFKAVLGMKTALKVTLLSQDNNINFEAGVGIWGLQAIPTAISMLFFWPVLITQIWGIIKQSNLDDKALYIAKQVIAANGYNTQNNMHSEDIKFCTNCGAKNYNSAKFCSECGERL